MNKLAQIQDSWSDSNSSFVSNMYLSRMLVIESKKKKNVVKANVVVVPVFRVASSIVYTVPQLHRCISMFLLKLPVSSYNYSLAGFFLNSIVGARALG